MSAPALQGPLSSTLFKVIRGCPSPEELAAVAALLTALSASAAPPAADADAGRSGDAAGWGRPEGFPPVSWMARR
ncbi:acyl-CoA carboxylase epsilon subunit [Streptomyces durocortorensis]|uniref:Acyl-CoA carboxylase subunit epsilon n=1 Tax=Streptomyces durocortorensis TaxID=2811104 RepID=A0ABS2I1U7_9ACTN|nr:acyl-CoA carboxylase epsilon subunit [Streptomyces durocortorensis]MBM7056850.1 acyl-CoA carboxylase subunit epsilon [Streptomyces durocortorensis]